MPILGNIRQKNEIVFSSRIYWDHEKPIDSNIFIKDFVDEIKFIINGVDDEILNQDKKKIIIKKILKLMPFSVTCHPNLIY